MPLMIGELLAVILVITILFQIGSRYASSDGNLQVYTAEELKLLVDGLIHVEGDVVTKYPMKNKFVVILTSDEIIVKSKGSGTLNKKLILPDGYQAVGSASSEEICVKKKDRSFLLFDCNEKSTV